MKIGTITFHCAYNYGSVLQSFALKTYLERLGNTVSVIDYRSPNFDQYKLFHPTNLRHLCSDILFFPRNIRRKHAFESFQRRHLNLTRRYEGPNAEQELSRDSNEFDAVICGSDQIWNLDCTQGLDGCYFLRFAPDSVRKIAYAPSLSQAQFQPRFFDEKTRNELGRLLDRFHAISVREQSTVPVYQQLTDKPIQVAIDPTLLLDASVYRNIESKLPKPVCNAGFIFAYTLWPNKKMIDYVDRLAQKEGLTIVYSSKIPIRYRSRAINCYGMSPELFLALIDKARYVISNSFHATVFSVLFHKAFLTFGKDRSTSRMSDLLSRLEIEDHIVRDDYDGDMVPAGADYAAVDGLLDRMRQDSEQFLKNALA
ncbi:polysaccharide pyruvyl transferase family protein [Bifidobacterium biavatii]|uniref:Polysaccharide pyruvyl transferase n=1 Tax=Bifidobacterium biavatii DSM 23969 TaxID=1437608 RepID=A0A086ZSZ9_9BIFI|nr:polysaccharide pyruvyl transferase family protein [Bifidobacterium biavatii]KFI49649.1 Polysaccharide pyruvyl transferase [Bifidobacterium biavatii DSM 23969]